MAYHGTSYGYSAEVAAKHKAKYDPAMESAIRRWLEQLTGRSIGGDFAGGLKNGVIICEAINKMKPGTVRRINTGTMPFKCMENIQNFLAGCRTFGIVDADLFAVVDLYEAKNMTLVLQGLHALARKDSRFRGPGATGGSVGSINDAPSSPSYASSSPSRSPSYGSSSPKYGSSARSGSSGGFVPSPSSGYSSSKQNSSNSTSGNLYGAKYGSSGTQSSPSRQGGGYVPSPTSQPTQPAKSSSGGLYGAVYGNESATPATRGAPSPKQSSPARAPSAGGGAKFCQSCGSKRDPPSSKFCGECGLRF